jgi:AraC family transcriptional regulator, transcriptional activator FtrA
MKKHLVVALAYDQLCTFEFGCAAEIFALNRPEFIGKLQSPWYDYAVHCIDKGKQLKAAGGLRFSAPYQPDLLDRADTIIIPGWKSLDDEPSPALKKALRAAHARGCRIATICSGVFPLAATGLLDGLRVTTHWRYAAQLAQRYPALQVLPDDLYVDEGLILSSAGSAAGLDMMLYMVQLDHGAHIANRVAQRLVIPLHRDGGQSQFIKNPVNAINESAGSNRISKLQQWVREHLGERHSIAQLAAKAAMTTRTLQRAFVNSTGLSPLHWITQERVYWSKSLLEQVNVSETMIAQQVGFGSLETFRYHFKQAVGVSPLRYRSAFSGR